jgi:branched-chain amino acid transport system substrate-binding protein
LIAHVYKKTEEYNMRRKKLAFAVMVLFLLAGFLFAEEPIKIGGLFVMSGGFASVLNYQLPAVQMVIDDVNKAGGIGGRQLQLITKDDQGDPSIVPQKLNELKAEGVSIILGPFLDTCGPAAAQWARANRFPIIMTCSMSTKVSIDNFTKYSFTSGPAAWAMAKVMARAAADEGVNSAYYIGPEGGVPTDLHTFFWYEIKKLKPSVVDLGASRTSQAETDLSGIISAALAKRPDLIVETHAGPTWVAFAQQAQRFNLFNRTKVMGLYILGPDNTEPFGKSYPKGVQAVLWSPFYSSDPKMAAFTKAYFAKTKLYPADITMTWELAILAAVAALREASSLSPDAIVKAIETTKFDSPIGEVYFREFDHQAIFPLYFGTSTYSKDWPIAIATNLIKYGADIFPSEAEMNAYKAGKIK